MSNEQELAGITRRAKGDPSPISYRIFWFDAAHKIVGSEVFTAEDDMAAVKIAIGMKNAAHRELWEMERLVAGLPATEA